MKRLSIVLFVLMAFLVAACAPATGPSAPTAGGQASEVKTPGEAAMESKCTFDAESVSAKAEVGKDVAAYPPVIKDISIGSCATFGIALGNYHNNLPQAIYTELKFVRAYDSYNNDPGVDKTYIPNWISTNFPQSFSLEPGKFVVFPVDIIIGDKMSETKNTKPATYEFELVTYTYKGNFKNEYVPPYRLTVKVK